MSFDIEDEIVQDFLVEAGEILELLGEQLVDLEQSPNDSDLLNAVFRGFHTIKGGASFIGLDNLVEVCHKAEDIFNLLRNGERQITAGIMDVFLRVLDTLNAMFDTVRAGNLPEPAEAALLEQLKLILSGGDPGGADDAQGASEQVAVASADEQLDQMLSDPEVQAHASAEPATGADEITEEEFENLLDDIHGKGKFAAAPKAEPAAPATTTTSVPAGSDDITEAEFEELLDKLHGKGKFVAAAAPAAEAPAVPASPPKAASAAPSSEDISEDEFEELLDTLHGKGKFVGAPVAEKPAAAVAKPVAAPPAAKLAPTKVAASQPAAPKPVAKDKDDADDAKKKEAAQAETTVRVDTKRLDDIMNMVGELVLVRNRLVTLQGSMANEEMTQAIGNLDLVTADLQAAVMKTRMQPIKKVFGRFPRVVRDLARHLKKEVQLELRGEETDLDKNLVEALADPLVHLVRNAVDHGIEMPQVREAAGKSRTGTVILSAEQEGDHILLIISDDGGGMNPNKLRQKAVEKGLMDEDAASRLTENDAYNLIFAPGFSTKDEISDISGRGVGMDVVKTRIVQLNGSVEIESQQGVGTRLKIKVPLTLAIMPTLMVMLDKQIFALPLVSVSEIFNLDLTQTNRVDGQVVIMLRDRPLPIYFLKKWLIKGAFGEEMPKQGHVVVVTIGNQKVGFVVEHLIGQEEVVIKPLGALLHGTKGLSGATITGDGRIALILDVPSLVKAYARRY
ncbi:MAG: chemotaxis protein CheA [Gammaproteobacteria bacterium]|nr:chemotaxis protein CheA [Gammaproteobacteria bacterium]